MRGLASLAPPGETRLNSRMKKPPPASLRENLVHAARTTLAAALSMLAARALGLPEYYWAPISTMIIMQCVLGAVQIVSWQQMVGTALGSAVGALLATFFNLSVAAYLVGVFTLGLLCAVLRLDRAAYRFAGVTLTVIMLIPRPGPIWVASFHRFIEVSLGIAVGVVVTALWPKQPAAPKQPLDLGA